MSTSKIQIGRRACGLGERSYESRSSTAVGHHNHSCSIHYKTLASPQLLRYERLALEFIIQVQIYKRIVIIIVDVEGPAPPDGQRVLNNISYYLLDSTD